jgi:hypothetical protein
MFGKTILIALAILELFPAIAVAQISNGILVKFKSQISINSRELQTEMAPAVHSIEKLVPGRTALKNLTPLADWYWFQLDTELALAPTLEKLLQLPSVEIAEPNLQYQVAEIPDDPFFTHQWALQPEGINWDPVSLANAPTGKIIIVGVLDTGIDIFHPDLAPNIWHNPAEMPGNKIDDDENGYVDDCVGWDFSDADNQPLPEKMENESGDFGWHGTHCAGILGAVTNNQEGISGVSPGVRVMSLKIFPEAYFSTIVRAINYAVKTGAHILSNSWGGAFGSQAVHDALRLASQQGVLCLFAAGNGAQDSYFFPAFYPEVVAVGACDRKGQRAWFSNFGAWVDFAAPGVDILSTGPTNYSNFPAYFYHSGTSMAVPLVAGVAALLKMQQPGWTNDLILQQLRRTADFHPAANLGAGCIDAQLALTCPPETTLTVFQKDLPGGIKHQNFHARLKAFAGAPPYQWALENPAELPAGLHFSSTGEINGVPRDTCDWLLQISVTDQTGKPVRCRQRLVISTPEFLTDITQSQSDIPQKAGLIRNFPNPFSPTRQSTTITFYLPDAGTTKIVIYNILGESVRHLIAARFSAGNHSLVWDGKNDTDSSVSPGFYFCRLNSHKQQFYTKILVVK